MPSQFTLIRKKQIFGPGKNGYIYERGEVISKAQYDELVPRHKSLFDEGVKSLTKQDPAQKKSAETVASLEERVSAIEAALGIGSEEKSEETKSKSKTTSSKTSAAKTEEAPTAEMEKDKKA